jgi:CBS domain-containing protein
MLGRLVAAALADRPPTGFLRHFVLHSSGERKGVLDIKHGGLLPIESLARWSGLAAGVTGGVDARAPWTPPCRPGRSRLPTRRTCATRSSSSPPCGWSTRSSSCGRAARRTTLIDPRALTPLTRSALKDAFRAVARIQRGIAVRQGLSAR